jgi:drug/metabolite transporter (DMT)-like permease
MTEILMIRQLMVTLILTQIFRGNLRRALRTDHLGLQVQRGLFSFGSQLGQFVALVYIPLAEVTALGFSQVIFITIAAAVILRETVGLRRWVATMVGFAGVLVMLWPSGEGLNPFALLAISSGLLSCGVTVTIRSMARTEATATIMLYQSIILCAAFMIPTALWWVTPTPREWTVLLSIGIVGSLGQYLFTSACQTGEAGALAPLEFTRLLIAASIGYVFFLETPSLSVLIGGSIVAVSTIYTVRRNAGAGRKVRDGESPDTRSRPDG